MQTASVALVEKLQRSVDMNAQVRVIGEWNFNRYIKNIAVKNGVTTAEEEYDHDAFPLYSIVDPERPTAGIAKLFANTGQAVVPPYADSSGGARHTVVSNEDKYKYWVAPAISSLTTGDIFNAAPEVVYGEVVSANKIQVTFETGHSLPTLFTIHTTTDGTNWTLAATNPTIASDGTVQLFRQVDNSWGSTPVYTNPTNLRGVKVTVTRVNVLGARMGVIEVGLRRVSDISTYVKTYSTDMEMSETSFLAPIGKATSNEAQVELDNTSMIFNNETASSPYFGLLEPNVKITIDLGINKGTLASPDLEWIRQFTGRVRDWAGQEREGTTAEISDDSAYLQSVSPPPILLQDVTAAEIIWRVMDSVGFAAWKYERSDIDPATVVPAFWIDGEKTAWEVIAEVAEVFQCAVYFNEYNVCQILTRSQAYSETATPVWQFDAVANGQKLPDIVNAETTRSFEANTVNIEYTPTAQSEETGAGVRPMEVIWEPEDITVLRSTQLTKTMTAVDTTFSIPPTHVQVWPYSGMVQIEGEFIKYDAKEYSFYYNATQMKSEWITSEEERVARDKISLSFNKGATNAFTGRIRIPAGGRGQWATTAMLHDITGGNWTSLRYRYGNGTIKNWAGGFKINTNESLLTLKTNANFNPSTFYVATVGSQADINQPIYYGTRFKFQTSGYTWGAGGLIIGAGNNDSGYYVDIQRTAILTTTSRVKYGGEIQVFYKSSTGVITRVNKGTAININTGVWYDLDAVLRPGTNSRSIDIMLNGVQVLTFTHNSTIPADNKGARSGLFVRGNTAMDFEYFYNSAAIAETPNLDNATWYNRIKGGYQSNQYDYEWSYGQYNVVGPSTVGITTSGASIKSPVRGSKRYMDDFGPIVHEVREYDVKFDKAPVTYSMVHFSNQSQVACPEYNSDAFNAKFVVTNISRDNAVLKGEDTLTFGADNPVDQSFLIYGRTFLAKDSRTHTVEDKFSVKKRGKIDTTVSSRWIQSEEAAKKLGEWIVRHWADGADEVRLNSFGNPILQLGDIVSVNYPSKSMLPATHKYFVVGISQNYSRGLQTSYVLRRRKT